MRPTSTFAGGKMTFTRDHSSSNLVIYVRVQNLVSPNRIAMRLRDSTGCYWSTRAETVNFEQVYPFYVDRMSDKTNIVAEVVLLKPLQAEFLVDTRTH
jgi:hypothetical protein